MKINLWCDLCQCMYEIEIGQPWIHHLLCPHLREVKTDGND